MTALKMSWLTICEVLPFSEADIKHGRKVKESTSSKRTSFKGRDVKDYVPKRPSVYNRAIFPNPVSLQNSKSNLSESESRNHLQKDENMAIK